MHKRLLSLNRGSFDRGLLRGIISFPIIFLHTRAIDQNYFILTITFFALGARDTLLKGSNVQVHGASVSSLM